VTSRLVTGISKSFFTVYEDPDSNCLWKIRQVLYSDGQERINSWKPRNQQDSTWRSYTVTKRGMFFSCRLFAIYSWDCIFMCIVLDNANFKARSFIFLQIYYSSPMEIIPPVRCFTELVLPRKSTVLYGIIRPHKTHSASVKGCTHQRVYLQSQGV
jgi:hypothetical protein